MILLGMIGTVALVVALVGAAAFVVSDAMDARGTDIDLPRAVALRRRS